MIYIYTLIICLFHFTLISCASENVNNDNTNNDNSQTEGDSSNNDDTENVKEKEAYLVAYMTGTDENHLYYALAEDDYIFKPLNDEKPIIGANLDDKLLRDPMIIKDKDGVYHMVATVSWEHRPFTVWDSKDLINWENERLVDVAPEGATATWAPEFAYDEENDIYMVYWTAEINDVWETASIYYSTTKDFKSFSETKLLYNVEGKGLLDANIIKVNDKYNLLYRMDNKVWIAKSDNAQGPYTSPYVLTDENVEGPFAFPLIDNKGYGIVWDYYEGSAGYGLWASKDFKQWVRITNPEYPYYNDDVEFPQGIRHGSIIIISPEEKNALIEVFGIKTE